MQQNDEMIQQIKEAVEAIRKQVQVEPEIGIILGTGLGRIAREITDQTVISYAELPHFPLSTAESHEGKLILGKLSGRDVVAMQGRFHYYEGYSMQRVTFPVRVMKFLGIKNLIISNACGSLNPYFNKSSIMIIDDHINLLGDNPLIGVNNPELGPRFVDMCEPYSKRLSALAEQVALEKGIKLHKGVFAAMTGPSLETRAEYRFLRRIGADAIGMSTIPEVIVARQMSLNVLGLSIFTDECYPDALRPVDISEILEAAAVAEPALTELVKEVVARI
jgi:purine-nucleoside phosphorylase